MTLLPLHLYRWMSDVTASLNFRKITSDPLQFWQKTRKQTTKKEKVKTVALQCCSESEHVYRHKPRELEHQWGAFGGNCYAQHLERPAISCEILFIFPPLSCENQEGFWEAQRFSIFAMRQLSSWLSSWEAGQFRVKQIHKMTGRRWGCSRKSICKPSLGRLLFNVLYKVNGNQGATIPESSSPLILNKEIKMGSLYPGAALASRPLGNKAPYRLSLDLKAQLETFICTEHLARRCEEGLFSLPPWLYFYL